MKVKKSTIVIIIVALLAVVLGVYTRVNVNRNPMLDFELNDIKSIKVEIRSVNNVEDKDVELSQTQIKEFLNCMKDIRMDHHYFTYNKTQPRYNFIIKRSNGKKYAVRHILDNEFKVDGVTFKATDETLNSITDFENKLK